jgi:hypothetical protein
MLFDAILTEDVENIAFIPMKIILVTSLGPFAKKRWFLERQLLGQVTFLFFIFS